MKSRAKVAAYPIVFVAFIAVLIVIGAGALWLIYRGEPAYAVHVVGTAATGQSISPVRWIRPSDVTNLPRGEFDEAQLLPLPPIPTYPEGPPGDELYQSLGEKRFRDILDQARISAQANKQALSTSLYEQLRAQFPDNRMLLMEYATVLGGFGKSRAAADVLVAAFPKFPRDAELRMLAAQNLWYEGQLLPADSVLGLVLAIEPNKKEARDLRETIRPLTEPDVKTAQRWLAERGGTREHLMLARAYVREQQYGPALEHYRAVANASVPTDSVIMEISSAAAAADSVQLLNEMTQLYLKSHPEDVANRLRLARAYSWRTDYDVALALYEDVLTRTGDAGVRLEKANVLMWAGREREAEPEVRLVLASEPGNVEATKLLGDIALYRGDWAHALEAYRTALTIDPDYPGVVVAIARANQLAEAARLAALPQPQPEAYNVAFTSYADNQNFRWFSGQAFRTFRAGRNSFTLALSQDVAQSQIGQLSGISTNPGYGGRLSAEIRPNDRLLFRLTSGVQVFDAVGSFPTYSADVSIYDFLGTTATLRFAHEPAMRRALTLVALHAQSTVNVAAVSVVKAGPRMTLAADLEREEFSSRVGGSGRWSAVTSADRVINSRLSAGVALSAVAGAVAPTLPGSGQLYWAPKYFVQPTVNVRYHAPISSAWAVSTGVNGGYAFVQERQTTQQRFTAGGAPVASANVELTYHSGPWQMLVGGTYGGSVGAGYKATTFQLQGSYQIK